MMEPREHTTYQEWLHLEIDGELTAAERRHLERHLTNCRDCRRERRQIADLGGLLAAFEVPVADGFRGRVEAALPATGWETRHPRSWAAALALFAILAGGAAALVGSGAAQMDPAAASVGAFLSILHLLQSSLLAGTGFLAASWKGVGLATGGVLEGSTVKLLALGVVVAVVDFWLLRLLLRRPAAEASASSLTSAGGRRSRLSR